MTTTPSGGSGQDSAEINPRLNAEQVLLRLLELIRSSESAADFTQEHLSKVMGGWLSGPPWPSAGWSGV